MRIPLTVYYAASGLFLLTTSVGAQDVFLMDPRIVDDGAKASLLSRTDPYQVNEVLRRCVSTVEQVRAGGHPPTNLVFCAAFDTGVASVAAHDHRPDAGAVAQQTDQRVGMYLTTLGIPPGQLTQTEMQLKQQVSGRLRMLSP